MAKCNISDSGKMANFADAIFQCEEPLHHWSDALKSSLAYTSAIKQVLTPNFHSNSVSAFKRILQFQDNFANTAGILQNCLETFKFIYHLAAAVPCWKLTIYHISCFDGLYLKKLRSACSILGQNIDNSFGPNGAQLGERWLTTSARSIALLLASFDVVLPSEREKPSWIDWRIEISPSTRWVLLSRFPAHRLHFWVSHHDTYCALRSFTSYRPVCIHALTSARAFTAATCFARPHAPP